MIRVANLTLEIDLHRSTKSLGKSYVARQCFTLNFIVIDHCCHIASWKNTYHNVNFPDQRYCHCEVRWTRKKQLRFFEYSAKVCCNMIIPREQNVILCPQEQNWQIGPGFITVYSFPTKLTYQPLITKSAWVALLRWLVFSISALLPCEFRAVSY